MKKLKIMNENWMCSTYEKKLIDLIFKEINIYINVYDLRKLLTIIKTEEMKKEITIRTQGKLIVRTTDSDEFVIGIDKGSALCLFPNTWKRYNEQAKENAEYIVKCVNAHDDLVNTLQECIREFKCYDMQKETLLLIDKINKLVTPL